MQDLGTLVREISGALALIGTLLILVQRFQKNKKLLGQLLNFPKDVEVTVTLSEVLLWTIIFALTACIVLVRLSYGF